MKNHENPPGIMKNQPRTMENHENRPGTMKNQPGTMKNYKNLLPLGQSRPTAGKA